MSAEKTAVVDWRWLVNALLLAVLGLVGYSYSGTCEKVNDHERRIQAVERTTVKMDFMQDDLAEIKEDVKKLVREGL